MKDIVILYHAECPDGFSAAWAAWKKFGDSAEYIPVHHNLPPPEVEDKEVYLLDFSYSEDEMKKLIRGNKRVTAIDHHVSREKEIKLTEDYLYSIDHSGAVLAWNYFHKEEPVPALLNYIEGQDLWKFNLPDIRPIVTFIDGFDYDFNAWDKLADEIEDPQERKYIIGKGQVMLDYKEEIMERIINENIKTAVFEGYETHVVNAPHEFASQIGEILCRRKPPIALIWIEGKDGIHVSMRSDGSVDVSEIAKKYGGGGHKASAGFGLPAVSIFPWNLVSEKSPHDD